jgi:hypothetical protein
VNVHKRYNVLFKIRGLGFDTNFRSIFVISFCMVLSAIVISLPCPHLVQWTDSSDSLF